MEWKRIPGFERYSVSTDGQVKSHHGKEKILVQSDNGNGYKKVYLSMPYEKRNMFVHRLVALAFIPNPNNLPFINHKDENPSNNNVDNLEWCDQKYNMNCGTVKERQRVNNHNNKRVMCEGVVYNSISECARCYGVTQLTLSQYLNNHLPMPEKWQKRNLHFILDNS